MSHGHLASISHDLFTVTIWPAGAMPSIGPSSSPAAASCFTLRDDAEPATRADVNRLEAKLDRLLVD